MPRSAERVQKIAQRLHVTQPLAADAALAVSEKQAHYLRNVLRLPVGAQLLLFNGRDGEWRGEIADLGKKRGIINLLEQTRKQPPAPDIWLLVAPVKKERWDYLAQKATEMGVGHLLPVITARTQGGPAMAKAVKQERMIANTIEAAEQCNILTVPQVSAVQPLTDVLADWPQDRRLIFCDEEVETGAGLDALDALGTVDAASAEKLALLIGPEGGFDAAERSVLAAQENAIRLSLGPRILRTDTAVVAALAVLQSRIGDWRS